MSGSSSLHSHRQPKITIIVLNWNGKQDTLRCLDSLRQLHHPHSVMVVDNCSTDDSVEAISQAYPEVELVVTEENLGYAEGNNVGIRRALESSPDYIFILNNDTTVDADILAAFCKRDLPIQGGLILQMHNPSHIDQLGGRWNSETGNFDAIARNAEANQWTEPLVLDFVIGAAMFIKADLFRQVGLFDSRFFLFWEECDWCARAARMGYVSTFCPEAKVYHRGSAAFVGGLPQTTYYWMRNRMLWIELNCDSEERRRLLRLCRAESWRTLRRYCMKSVQALVAPATASRQTRLRTYLAELTAVRHYYRRRFGEGPAWLSKRTSPSRDKQG